MKALRGNLLLQFSIVSFIVIALIATAAAWVLSRTLTNNIIDEAIAEA